MWVYNRDFVSMAKKADRSSGNHGSLGNAMPADAVCDLSVDAQHRLLFLWLYPGDAANPGGLTMAYPFDSIAIDPREWPTGRIDVTGDPAPFYHADVKVLKATVVAWDGGRGGPQPLFRWNSGWMWVE